VVRIVVLADTHLRNGRRLPDAVYERLESADVVLHAGDVVSDELLDELDGFGELHVVRGNNDGAVRRTLPETWQAELGGVRVAMVHDSGATKGRGPRMRRWFPDAAVVVYGHSHLPDDSLSDEGQRLFNPGSPTQRRRAPTPSFGELELVDGRIRRHAIVALPVPARR
jgi:putative phosphoesterase